jgi:hypothetical protein
MSPWSLLLSGLFVWRVDSSSDSGSGVHDRARDEPREDNDKSSEGGRLDLDIFRL